MQTRYALSCIAASAAAVMAVAQPRSHAPFDKPDTTPPPLAGATVTELPDGRVEVNGVVYHSWADLAPLVYDGTILRCAMPEQFIDGAENGPLAGGSAADCSASSTTIDPSYDPATRVYRIPVVVHVIENTSGTGALTDAMVESQIEILNEDFRAIPGTNGALGTDIQLHFFLADRMPDGTPTDGIMNYVNNTWFADGGAYYNTIAWDPTQYLNIYTNNVGGLGYVPYLPQTGTPGALSDRVVCLYSAFGRNSPFVPFDQGRTGTHEVGHYLGLFHTFHPFPSGTGPCVGNCYTVGDLICDTNTETTSNFGCTDEFECSTVDPFHNYMNYSDDLCMTEFTPEQGNRIRCTIEHWRPDLFNVCETDVNLDMTTGVPDLLDLLAAWGPCIGCPEDVNGDGVVGIADMLQLLAGWGRCWEPLGPPENDDCVNHIPFESVATGGCVEYDTTRATTDGPPVPALPCTQFDGQTHYDIWYTYTATATGTMTVSTCDDIIGVTADYDTDLVVYGPYDSIPAIDCDPAALNANVAGCNDDDTGNSCGTAPPYSSTVNVAATAGKVYLIRVGGWDAGSTSLGTATICVIE